MEKPSTATGSIKFLLIVFALFLSFFQTELFAQDDMKKDILINGKISQISNSTCKELSTINSIGLITQNQDSVVIEVTLARGAQVIGGKRFNSINEFNSFNMRDWLKLAYNSTQVKGAGFNGNDYSAKLSAKPGDRILIETKSGGFYNIQFCK